MAGFGWSAGDLVRAIELIVTITGALRDSGGASEEFQESVQFLCGLELTLQNLRTIFAALPHACPRNLLDFQAGLIEKPVTEFINNLQAYDPSLAPNASKTSPKVVARKIQWAVYTSKKVKKLQSRLMLPLLTLNSSIALETM